MLFCRICCDANKDVEIELFTIAEYAGGRQQFLLITT